MREQKRSVEGVARTGRQPAAANTAANARLTRERLDNNQRANLRQAFGPARARPATRVNFALARGTRIPRSVRLFALPVAVLAILPAYGGYRYFYADDRICVVEPSTYEIVDVIDEDAYFGTGGTQTAILELNRSQRELVLSFMVQDSVAINLSVDLALGAEVSSDMPLYQFAPEVLSSIPQLGSYRYVAVDGNVAIINPDNRAVVLIVRRD